MSLLMKLVWVGDRGDLKPELSRVFQPDDFLYLFRDSWILCFISFILKLLRPIGFEL